MTRRLISKALMIGLVSLTACVARAQVQCVGEWMSLYEATSQIEFTDFSMVSTVPRESRYGPALFMFATYVPPQGPWVEGILKWDGASWQVFDMSPITGLVSAVTRRGSDQDEVVYLGGSFRTAPNGPRYGVITWNGDTFSTLPGESNTLGGWGILTLTSLRIGEEDLIVAGGQFTSIGGVPAQNVASWNGNVWSQLGGGRNAFVRSTIEFDDGTGPAIYASGWFEDEAGGQVSRVARWRGQDWEPIGFDIDGHVNSFVVVPEGGAVEPGLYAAGPFVMSADPEQRFLARWTGQGWVGIPGLSGTAVDRAEVMDDGSGEGPAIFVAGYFNVPGAGTQLVAKWNGLEWIAIGETKYGRRTISELASFPGDDVRPATLFLQIEWGEWAVWQGCLTEPCPGDTNGDNLVDFADLNAVLATFGLTQPGLPGDLNGDGTVNFTDLNLVLAAFGNGC